ncbi:hypothetical protein [Rhabdothermincola salaria]|uniref:hypothetical protein n=1 Tax=Rhabdothermincola salaria TaxID=2903142 RepID=UPI001E356CC5|nr:hypothetical protein [Rhabdothermincola salaria]MCD9625255.1 hypothetical protein [Rhabdothermincola salaria]
MRALQYHHTTDLDTAFRMARDLGASVVVLDVHGTVASFDVQGVSLQHAAAEAIELAGTLGLADIVLLSNARLPFTSRDIGVPVTERARKPWRRLPRLRHRRDAVVIGDQLITDGFLAWRLGAPFVHCTPYSRQAPALPRAQHLIGRCLRRTLMSGHQSDGVE